MMNNLKPDSGNKIFGTVVCSHCIFDECEDVQEMIDSLLLQVQRLTEFRNFGVELVEIEDGHAIFVTEDEELANVLDLDEMPPENGEDNSKN